jgi:hypothetical protein
MKGFWQKQNGNLNREGAIWVLVSVIGKIDSERP